MRVVREVGGMTRAALFILAWLCVAGAVALTLWPRATQSRDLFDWEDFQ